MINVEDPERGRVSRGRELRKASTFEWNGWCRREIYTYKHRPSRRWS